MKTYCTGKVLILLEIQSHATGPTEHSSQVLGFGGQQNFAREKIFIFIACSKNFAGYNKIWGALPTNANAPRGYGPGPTYYKSFFAIISSNTLMMKIF